MSDLLLAKLFYFISWFHIKLSHTLIFRCWFISFEIYAKVGVVDSFFPIIITMSLPMSFCTNSMALPLAYQVNGSNTFIIVFLVFVSVLVSIHSSHKKMPLHIKKNISVTLILTDSWWFSVILANSQWFLNKSKPWFLLILNDSWWFSNKSGIDSH